MRAATKEIDADMVFTIARVDDPFKNIYLQALMRLDLIDRRRILNQVILLCARVEQLEPLDALELLAKVGGWMNATG